MEMTTYPLNGVEYDAQDAELYFSLRKSGIFTLDDFKISIVTSNTVVVGDGRAWIGNSKFSGKVVATRNDTTLEFDVGDSSFDRIDVIAIVFDKANNKTELTVIKGTEQLPTPAQTEDVYQLFLYAVTVKKGSLTIHSEDIVDLRQNSEYCGIMEDGTTNYILEQNNSKPFRVWVGTTEEYEALPSKDPFTMFLLTDDDTEGILQALQSSVNTLQNYIDSVKNGTQSVPNATYAQSAAYANNASNANFATTAQYVQSGGGLSVEYANNAGNADYATTAGNAATADRADYATVAQDVAQGTTVESAAYASRAGVADQATQAEYDSSGNIIANTYATNNDLYGAYDNLYQQIDTVSGELYDLTQRVSALETKYSELAELREQITDISQETIDQRYLITLNQAAIQSINDWINNTHGN